MRHFSGIIIAVAVSAFLSTGCAEQDQNRADRADDDRVTAEVLPADHLERGRLAYHSFCASCHGTDGRGDGPVADVLTEELGDLTLLKQENQGVYPADKVYESIDGRDGVRGHGTREMPVWGHVWMEDDGTPVRQEFVEARINELVEYIRTIQEVEEGAVPASAEY